MEVEIDQSGSNEASQQVLLEALPSILVLHLEPFLYGAATDGINKISKSVQFGPELEIPLGTIFSIDLPLWTMAENPALLDLSRNHGTRFWEICGASFL